MNYKFRSTFSENIFNHKYRQQNCQTWPDLADTIVRRVCSKFMTKDEVSQLVQYVIDMKFIPGGRYLYYSGREMAAFNNCFLFRSEEDTREDWAKLSWQAESCLMLGGGIGNDYSVYRPSNQPLHRTGGVSSGPIPKMEMINEIGRHVMQGGSRRSAIYASLNWKHGDISQFLKAKNWFNMPAGSSGLTLQDLKEQDFNFRCPLDMTNISVNYDTEWLLKYWKTGSFGDVFLENCKQALRTGEPGFSFNFFQNENETLRNA
jgi:ribonucleoside-diphosphate reductase alpha chain